MFTMMSAIHSTSCPGAAMCPVSFGGRAKICFAPTCLVNSSRMSAGRALIPFFRSATAKRSAEGRFSETHRSWRSIS